MKYTEIRVSYLKFFKTPCWMGLPNSSVGELALYSVVTEHFPSTKTRGRSLQARRIRPLVQRYWEILVANKYLGQIWKECTQVIFPGWFIFQTGISCKNRDTSTRWVNSIWALQLIIILNSLVRRKFLKRTWRVLDNTSYNKFYICL